MAIGRSSFGRGVLGGLLAVAIAIPVLPVALAVVGLSELAMLAKLFHVHHASGSEMTGEQRSVGAWLVALVTGFVTGAIAGYWSCRVVRGGRREAFVASAAVSLAALLAIARVVGHLRPTSAHILDGPLLALCWVAAVVAFALVSDPRFIADQDGKMSSLDG